MGLAKHNNEIPKEIFHAFSNEEIKAIKESVPMTQELFISIMNKCEKIGSDANAVFIKMLDEDKYEKFLDAYEEQLPWNLSDEMKKEIEAIRNRELTEKETRGMKSFIIEALAFSEEQNYSINGLIPMTQEMFDSIVERCTEIGSDADYLFFRMLEQYPDFMEERAKKIEEEVKEADLSPLDPELDKIMKQYIDAKIKEYQKKA